METTRKLISFESLRPYLDLHPDQVKSYKSSGIPAQDSTNNQLIDWIHVVTAFEGKPMTIMVKGDDAAANPSFQAVLIALKKNDQLKFKLVTNPVAAPPGSELAKRQLITGNKSSEE
ncbi:MAG TPA: hypothetical protein VHE34_03780 [Puia sp.]|uniref:hypothetical protein n=1 Tax=Puia sp. TaxID=2045100 RepID=UPI002C4607CB|nr:hypothetical protein [Puia sp.]HVU94314.1 hypothetical protein [Puia sp.]